MSAMNEWCDLESPLEGISSSKEPSGLSRTDGKRPDWASLVPWTRGRFIAWDTTAIHTCTSSYLHLTSTVSGGAAEQAAKRKRTEYSSHPLRTNSSHWPLNHLALLTTRDYSFYRSWTAAWLRQLRETIHLCQRLSVCAQCFNAVTFRDAFEQLESH